MTTGNTNTGTLNDSLPSIIAEARQVREYEGVMTKVVDVQTLGRGNGLTWNEVSLAKLTAQDITETTELDNPQAITDTLFSVTPTISGIQIVMTDLVQSRISANALAQTGSLGQNAIERKKDIDGLTILDSGTSLAGAGTALTSGHVAAAISRIQGNATEQGMPPYRMVAHPFQIKDIQDEIVAGVGTYPIDSGLTARVFTQGFSGMLYQAQVFPDGNISIDSADDAKGGVFPEEGIVLVQGMAPRVTTVRNEALGGGADVLYIYDDYAYGERSAGNWLFELYSDATAPTS